MENVIIKCQYCEHLSQEEIIQRASVSMITNANESLARNFLLNNAPLYAKLPLDGSFLYSILDNGNNIILGVLVFTENDIRTKIQIDGEDEKPRNYHELSHLIMDYRLFDSKFLIHLFTKTFLPLIKEDDNQEVFWMEHKGRLYSRVTDIVAKKHPKYYYENEAEYFSQNVLQIIEMDFTRKQNFYERLKKNAPE